MSQGGRHSLFELLAGTSDRDEDREVPADSSGERVTSDASADHAQEVSSEEQREPKRSFWLRARPESKKRENEEAPTARRFGAGPDEEKFPAGRDPQVDESPAPDWSEIRVEEPRIAEVRERELEAPHKSRTTPRRAAVSNVAVTKPRTRDAEFVEPTESERATWLERAQEQTAAASDFLNRSFEVRGLLIVVATLVVLSVVLLAYLVGAGSSTAPGSWDDPDLKGWAFQEIPPGYLESQYGRGKQFPVTDQPRSVDDGTVRPQISPEDSPKTDDSSSGVESNDDGPVAERQPTTLTPRGTHRVDVLSGRNRDALISVRDELVAGGIDVGFELIEASSRNMWTLSTTALSKEKANQVASEITKLRPRAVVPIARPIR